MIRRLQVLKLRTHDEDNSDIGTRKTGEKGTRRPMVKVPGTSKRLVDSRCVEQLLAGLEIISGAPKPDKAQDNPVSSGNYVRGSKT